MIDPVTAQDTTCVTPEKTCPNQIEGKCNFPPLRVICSILKAADIKYDIVWPDEEKVHRKLEIS